MFVVRSSECDTPRGQSGLPCLERRIPHTLLEPHISYASVIVYPHTTTRIVERLTPYAELLYFVCGRTRCIIGDDLEPHAQEISAGDLLIIPPDTRIREHAIEQGTKIFRLALSQKIGGEQFLPIHLPYSLAQEHTIFHNVVNGAEVSIEKGGFVEGESKKAKRAWDTCTVYFILDGTGMITIGSYAPDPINIDDVALVPQNLSHSILTFDGFPLEFLRIDIQ
jgi:mannose-6-phosphate isomerase-like protein (cupin superfamily)